MMSSFILVGLLAPQGHAETHLCITVQFKVAGTVM